MRSFSQRMNAGSLHRARHVVWTCANHFLTDEADGHSFLLKALSIRRVAYTA